jgi:HPt (histidine-containing phosphotransfer) domain-containing protein
MERGYLDSFQVINRELLDESCGGDTDFARELFGDLNQRARELQQELHAGFAARDADRVRKAAHELKGSSLTLGAERVGQVSRELEDSGRNADIEDCAPILARLDQELDTLRDQLIADGFS